ncbi:hypothetical protein GGS20DRAFT_562213 [Poronia punctata]|nr:hypothetical protein GGS20DRAFT_562213 [Poronia punctata]
MAPSNEILEEYLKDATRRLYEADPNSVTVNSVRQEAEEHNGLEKGFFVTAEWKSRSKAVITESVQQHLSNEPSSPASPPTKREKITKRGVKRSSSDDLPPKGKRQKPTTTAVSRRAKPKRKASSPLLSELEDSDLESDKNEKKRDVTKKAAARKSKSDSELSDIDLSDEPKTERKSKAKKPATSRRSQPAKQEVSESSDLSDLSSEESSESRENGHKVSELDESDSDNEGSKPVDSTEGLKRKQNASNAKRNTKRAKVESDSGDESSVESKDKDATETEDTKIENSEEGSKVLSNESKASAGNDSDSSLSSVLDEPPVKKRKGKGSNSRAAPKSKPTTAKEITGDEAEIKKLQGQLVKCGVRKIWGIELKKFGSDSRAKIRHLKAMLSDVGMDGRFSEAKARQIKEKRELLGELEAVNEMNELWGIEGRRGRAAKNKAARQSLKEDSEDDEQEAKVEDDEDDEEDEDPEDTKAKNNPRVSKRMADLAFLGSESESD